jgi:peroxiredoxin
MIVSRGAAAPDAKVFKAPRQPVQLRELYGSPTVLLFFPMAFSSTCTEEMCTMSEDLARYESLGARVYGISVDSPYVNQHYAREYNLKFPILSDFNKEATAAFGVLSDLGDLRGVSQRSAFVIDGNGLVRYSWLSGNPGELPPFAELQQAVQTLDA